MKTIILDKTQIERIIKRISYQIVEHCFEESEIVLVGIKPRGIWVAQQLQIELKTIQSGKIELLSATTENDQDFDSIASELSGKCVVLVDDILNSGQTMMVAASKITLHQPNRLITACLVDRKHRKFPIHSDFTGLSLATTIQEHLTLDIENGPFIFLN